MAYAGLQTTVNLYILQEADLTNRIADIMQNITRASSKTSQILEEENAKKNALRDEAKNNPTYADSTQYDSDMSAIEEDYELRLSEITQWEKELETEKDSLETQLQATTAYKESFIGAVKQNVQKAYKYGGQN